MRHGEIKGQLGSLLALEFERQPVQARHWLQLSPANEAVVLSCALHMAETGVSKSSQLPHSHVRLHMRLVVEHHISSPCRIAGIAA